MLAQMHRLVFNSNPIPQGDDLRVGYEETPTGKDLIIWLKMKTNDAVVFCIAPQ